MTIVRKIPPQGAHAPDRLQGSLGPRLMLRTRWGRLDRYLTSLFFWRLILVVSGGAAIGAWLDALFQKTTTLPWAKVGAKIPFVAHHILPFAILLASAWWMLTLMRTHQLPALQSSGISLGRMMRGPLVLVCLVMMGDTVSLGPLGHRWVMRIKASVSSARSAKRPAFSFDADGWSIVHGPQGTYALVRSGKQNSSLPSGWPLQHALTAPGPVSTQATHWLIFSPQSQFQRHVFFQAQDSAAPQGGGSPSFAPVPPAESPAHVPSQQARNKLSHPLQGWDLRAHQLPTAYGHIARILPDHRPGSAGAATAPPLWEPWHDPHIVQTLDQRATVHPMHMTFPDIVKAHKTQKGSALASVRIRAQHLWAHAAWAVTLVPLSVGFLAGSLTLAHQLFALLALIMVSFVLFVIKEWIYALVLPFAYVWPAYVLWIPTLLSLGIAWILRIEKRDI